MCLTIDCGVTTKKPNKGEKKMKELFTIDDRTSVELTRNEKEHELVFKIDACVKNDRHIISEYLFKKLYHVELECGREIYIGRHDNNNLYVIIGFCREKSPDLFVCSSRYSDTFFETIEMAINKKSRVHWYDLEFGGFTVIKKEFDIYENNFSSKDFVKLEENLKNFSEPLKDMKEINEMVDGGETFFGSVDFNVDEVDGKKVLTISHSVVGFVFKTDVKNIELKCGGRFLINDSDVTNVHFCIDLEPENIPIRSGLCNMMVTYKHPSGLKSLDVARLIKLTREQGEYVFEELKKLYISYLENPNPDDVSHHLLKRAN